MRFYNLKDRSAVGEDLSDEYKTGRGYGAVTIGSEHLFVKKRLKIYSIAYIEAERIFRRVRRVNAQMCCDNGELELDYLVVSADGRELVEVELPGKKAARMLMDELKATVTGVELAAP